jgi:hypothetical protein
MEFLETRPVFQERASGVDTERPAPVTLRPDEHHFRQGCDSGVLAVPQAE